MLKKIVRAMWSAQPRWLRRCELAVLERALRRPLDPRRPLKPGDAVVCGLLGTASGLGQTARQMLELLQRSGFPARGANASRFAVLEDFEAGPFWPDAAGPDGIAVFHINPDIFTLVAGALGRQRLMTRRIVGFWAWELDVIPPQWVRTLRQVDEVWVPSRFIADALSRAAPGKPVHALPPCLDVESVPTVPRRDPLPALHGKTVVFFMYDVRSTHARKNPEAVVDAFRRAAGNDPNAALVIKIGNAHAWPESLERVRAAAEGLANVTLMQDKLDAESMKDLMARADIVMSLHRSEGFGFLVAEAMAAGKPVIATGWSGNREFMTPECSVILDYKLVPIVDPQRAYDRYGARWAEPDVAQAAEALRRLLDNPAERRRMGDAARAHIAQTLSKEKWLAALPQSFHNAVRGGQASDA